MFKKNKQLLRTCIGICILFFILICSTGIGTSFVYAKTNPEDEGDSETDVFTDTYSISPTAISEKNYSNIVLFAYFQDQTDGKDYFLNTENVSDIMNIYDGSHGRSFASYMNTISYGNFQVLNVFPQYDAATGTIHATCLSIDSSQAETSNVDNTILKEVLADVTLSSEYLDLDNDGVVDNVTVIMKGGDNVAQSNNSLYPHKGNFQDASKVSGKSFGTYNMISTYRLRDSFLAEEGGLVAHEFLHSLGYPDLYEATDKIYPVYTWDIMAKNSAWPAWPLAYLRMHFSNWVQLDTVTVSQTITLDDPGKVDGNQAYILKSPLNDHEVFVVEMRTRNIGDSDDTLDSKISLTMKEGESGLIVYRVDTTVEDLSNHHGDIGVYVFRPQSDSYSSQISAIQDAYLSPSSGRTSIGTNDMSAGLLDGALTFSDGTNSGIQIKNVAVSGDQMTCEVIIPDENQFDLWKNTELPTASGSSSDSNAAVAMTSFQDMQYVVADQNDTFSLYCYDGSEWQTLASAGKETKLLGSDIKLVAHDQKLYLAYIAIISDACQLRLKVYDPASNTWSNAALHNGTSTYGYDMQSIDETLYIVYDEGNQAKLMKFKGTDFEELGTYYSSGYGGQPQVVEVDNNIYVTFRRSNNVVDIYRYNGAQSFTKVSNDTIISNTYGIIGHNNKLMVVKVDNKQTTVYSYDGSNWATGQTSNVECFDPKLATAQGNLYMLTSPSSGEGYTYVYQYDDNADSWTQEGEMVDAVSYSITLTSTEDHLYISYVLNSDHSIIVRKKMVANQLLSLSITPPTKTVYLQGEDVDTSGLSVTANYQRGSRTLSELEYMIKGFDTETVGKRTATVSFGGLTESFEYEVQETKTGTGTETKTTIDTPKLSSVSNTATGVKITWGKVTGAEKYRVFYKTGSGSWKKIADTSSTSYTWKSAKSGTKYTFTVRCITSDGKNYTSSYDKTGKSLTYIAAPKISSVSNTSTGVKITWGKVTGAEKYRVYYKTGSGSWKKIADTTSTSYTWKSAKSGTKYTFTVRCITSDGKSFTSAYDTTGKSLTYIAAPKISSVSNTATGMKITWGKVTGATKYRLYYKTAGSSWKKIADTTSTSYIWKSAKSGTKYTFTVRCVTSDGKSFTSSYDATGKSLTYIAAPKISSVSNTSTGVKITWGKVTGAAKYRVYYKIGSGSWKKVADTTSTSYTWKSAKSGTKYTFTVRCITSDGKSFTSSYNTTGKSITYRK